MSRRLLSLVVLAVPLLAACGGLSGTNDENYISGNGQVISYAVAHRGDAVTLTGTLLDGSKFDPASVKGKVTVVNVWGAWCGECSHEARFVQQAHDQLGNDVAFLGVDIRDTSAATARSFERSHGLTYPSLYSADGRVLRALPRGKVPGAIPSTLVLDAKGRVAAAISGAIPSTLTLVETVQCVQDPVRQHC